MFLRTKTAAARSADAGSIDGRTGRHGARECPGAVPSAEREAGGNFWRGPRLAPGPAIVIMLVLAAALWVGVAIFLRWLGV
jgi:hypothetical protein